MPEPEFREFAYPQGGAYVGKDLPSEKYQKLGLVRVKYDFNTLDPQRDAEMLCRNAYNKATRDLLARAKAEKKADAVIQVQSVVFYLDGNHQLFDTAECSDEGGEGQILLQGYAVKFVSDVEISARRGAARREMPNNLKLTTLPEPSSGRQRKRVRASDPEAIMRFVPEKKSADAVQKPQPEPSPTARPVPQSKATSGQPTRPSDPPSFR